MTWSWRTGSNWEGSTERLVLWGHISSRYCTYYTSQMPILQNSQAEKTISAAPWALISVEVIQSFCLALVVDDINEIISLCLYFEGLHFKTVAS